MRAIAEEAGRSLDELHESVARRSIELLDAMRDGDTDGMQHFDAEIEKLVRDGVVDPDTGFTYATNPGNLRLELADFLDGEKKPKHSAKEESELELTP